MADQNIVHDFMGELGGTSGINTGEAADATASANAVDIANAPAGDVVLVRIGFSNYSDGANFTIGVTCELTRQADDRADFVGVTFNVEKAGGACIATRLTLQQRPRSNAVSFVQNGDNLDVFVKASTRGLYTIGTVGVTVGGGGGQDQRTTIEYPNLFVRP